jgi:RHS repeat-associated protein
MPTHSRNTILLATDQQRSVLSALNAHVPHPIAYSPYGHRPAENGLLSLLGFNGELPDPLTGHYHLGKGYRQFNPVLMRFNSPDSLSPFGKGGLNTYCYCLGDPGNRIDPKGHASGPIGRFFSRLLGIPVPSRKNALISKINNNEIIIQPSDYFASKLSFDPNSQFENFSLESRNAEKFDNKVYYIETYKNNAIIYKTSRIITKRSGKHYASFPDLQRIKALDAADQSTKDSVNALNTHIRKNKKPLSMWKAQTILHPPIRERKASKPNFLDWLGAPPDTRWD